MAVNRNRPPSGDGPQGTGRLRGRVVSADTGEPLGSATVLAWAERLPPREATADADGRYELGQLPSGAYLVSARHDGYLGASYGQRRLQEPGTAVTLDEGQTVEGIDLALPRAGAITVRLTDDAGAPVERARVLVQRFQYMPGGEHRVTNAAIGPHGLARTDAAGEVRVTGLPPGEYVIRAEVHTIRRGDAPAVAATEGFSPTYYPGTISADGATLIPVGVGEEIALQFSLVRVPVFRVSGTVVRSSGEPAAGMELMIGPGGDARGTRYGAGTVAADGTFGITGVPAGTYTLQVRERVSFTDVARGGGMFVAGRGEMASVPLVVGATDIDGFQIVTSPGTTIDGVVVFDGASPRPVASELQVFALPPGLAGGGWYAAGSHPADFPPAGRVDEDGRFRITGASGRVQLDLMAKEWLVKSITLGPRDITNVPLDLEGTGSLSEVVIILTDRVSTVTGHVHDAEARRVPKYVVVLLPANANLSDATSARIHVAHPTGDGRFTLTRIRPGRYLAAALDWLEWGRQYDPAVQGRLRQIARPVTVDEGQTVTLELELAHDA